MSEGRVSLVRKELWVGHQQ